MSHQSDTDETIFVEHGWPEVLVDLGEVRMNYAHAGAPERPALLLIPGQSASWWSYEPAMAPLAEHFDVYAVDLRGQGRSTRTPGRYTLDNMGNDLVRFIDLVIGRPTVVSGNSSGGILAAWLAGYAQPGQVRAVVCEDAPFFACEQDPAVGPGIHDSIGPLFALWNTWLGDQWSRGDWDGLLTAMARELPRHVLVAIGAMFPPPEGAPPPDLSAGPPQNLREYDPEWGRAFVSGSATAGCDLEVLLAAVRCPLLLTHHFRQLDPETGCLAGALSDAQAERAIELVRGTGHPAERQSFPTMAHAMHAYAPELFTTTVAEWAGRWG